VRVANSLGMVKILSCLDPLSSKWKHWEFFNNLGNSYFSSSLIGKVNTVGTEQAIPNNPLRDPSTRRCPACLKDHGTNITRPAAAKHEIGGRALVANPRRSSKVRVRYQ